MTLGFRRRADRLREREHLRLQLAAARHRIETLEESVRKVTQQRNKAMEHLRAQQDKRASG